MAQSEQDMSNNQNLKTFSRKTRVYCHLCCLKGLCPDTIRHTQSSYRIEKHRGTELDFKNVKESTLNCPLKILVNAACPHVFFEVEF